MFLPANRYPPRCWNPPPPPHFSAFRFSVPLLPPSILARSLPTLRFCVHAWPSPARNPSGPPVPVASAVLRPVASVLRYGAVRRCCPANSSARLWRCGKTPAWKYGGRPIRRYRAVTHIWPSPRHRYPDILSILCATLHRRYTSGRYPGFSCGISFCRVCRGFFSL